MEEKNLLTLGELFRDLRIARGLKLKDVARDNLSVSQLSKFENGQTMLAADKLLIAISGIHMSLAEFGYALNQYKEDDFYQLSNKIQELHAQMNLEGLKILLEKSKDSEEYETYNQLQQIVIKSSIFSLAPTMTISKKETDFLTEYLFSIEEWTEYEVYIFGNTLNILSDEDLIFLGKAFIERDKFYLSIPHYKRRVEVVTINLTLTLIERRQLYHASYFMEKLDNLITYQDMFAAVVLKFMRKILAYLNGQSVTVEEIRNYIDLVEEVGGSVIANLLKIGLDQILS